MAKPLEGVRVLDLTRVLAGPYCTMLLADMGADVVKVERPGAGDDTRAYGPPFLNGESAYFMSVNRNKRSMTLDFRNEQGLDVLKRLIEAADVVVENFRPGTMEGYGLGYEQAKDLNPGLVFCSISGYGHTGPDAELPGYDLIIQGEGGIVSLTGDTGGPPYKAGTSQADIIAGMMGFQGILLALIARDKTDRGQKVDIGMLDCQVALLTYQAGIYFATGESPTRMGNQHPTIAPYETYRCKDGYVNVACGNDSLFRRFCTATGKPWAEEERFATNAERVKNRVVLGGLMAPLLMERTRQEWIDLLRKAGIPGGEINTIRDVCESPQVRAREMVVTLEHPKAGAIRVTGVPIKLSQTPGAVETPPPLLGQHTEAIMADWLKLSSSDIESLRQAGAF